jgi:hypothetical protein
MTHYILRDTSGRNLHTNGKFYDYWLYDKGVSPKTWKRLAFAKKSAKKIPASKIFQAVGFEYLPLG